MSNIRILFGKLVFLAFNISKIFELYEGLGDPKYISDFSALRRFDAVLKSNDYLKGLDLHGIHLYLGNLGMEDQFYLSASLLVAYFAASMLLLLNFRKLSVICHLCLYISDYLINHLPPLIFSKNDLEYSSKLLDASYSLSLLGLSFIVGLFEDLSDINDPYISQATKKLKFSQRIKRVNHREFKQVLNRS